MAKTRWLSVQEIGPYIVYGRRGRGELICRVERKGDTTKYAEWGYPMLFGLQGAMNQAALDTKPDDIRA